MTVKKLIQSGNPVLQTALSMAKAFMQQQQPRLKEHFNTIDSLVVLTEGGTIYQTIISDKIEVLERSTSALVLNDMNNGSLFTHPEGINSSSELITAAYIVEQISLYLDHVRGWDLNHNRARFLVIEFLKAHAKGMFQQLIFN